MKLLKIKNLDFCAACSVPTGCKGFSLPSNGHTSLCALETYQRAFWAGGQFLKNLGLNDGMFRLAKTTKFKIATL